MEIEGKELIDSWKFISLGENDFEIVILLQLAFDEPSRWSRPLSFIFDTGYDGDILLTDEMFYVLGYSQNILPKKFWRYGETISGEIIELKRSKTQIKIKNNEFDVIIESGNVSECLVGRKFISLLIAYLDGPNREISLYK